MGEGGLPVFLEELVGLAEAVVEQHVDAGQRQLRVLDGQRRFPVLPPRRRLLGAGHDAEESSKTQPAPPYLPTHPPIYLSMYPGGSVLLRRARREEPGAPGGRGGTNRGTRRRRAVLLPPNARAAASPQPPPARKPSKSGGARLAPQGAGAEGAAHARAARPGGRGAWHGGEEGEWGV